MKKTILFMICLGASLYVFGSCYSTWSAAFDEAIIDYSNNLQRCQNALSKVRCYNEANLAYDHAVNIAGEAYYSCVNQE